MLCCFLCVTSQYLFLKNQKFIIIIVTLKVVDGIYKISDKAGGEGRKEGRRGWVQEGSCSVSLARLICALRRLTCQKSCEASDFSIPFCMWLMYM